MRQVLDIRFENAKETLQRIREVVNDAKFKYATLVDGGIIGDDDFYDKACDEVLFSIKKDYPEFFTTLRDGLNGNGEDSPENELRSGAAIILKTFVGHQQKLEVASRALDHIDRLLEIRPVETSFFLEAKRIEVCVKYELMESDSKGYDVSETVRESAIDFGIDFENWCDLLKEDLLRIEDIKNCGVSLEVSKEQGKQHQQQIH